MQILCFDIGGTNIKYKLLGIEKETNLMDTRKNKEQNFILEDVLEKISEYNKKYKINAIGISTAGVVDNVSGSVIFAGPTIPGYTNTNFKEIVEKKFGIPCFVENDVNSAAFGEYVFSNLTGDTVCITIGTGLGGAIIIDDKIYSGKNMTAGEIGYMPYKGEHIQKYASATYIVNRYFELAGEKLNGKKIFEKAKTEDSIALKVIEEMIDAMSVAILNIMYLLNPKQIIVGGGITAQGEYLEKLIIDKVSEKVIDKKFLSKIQLARLSNDAGLFGIYNIVLRNLKNLS